MPDFYKGMKEILASEKDSLSPFTYDTYLWHIRKLRQYRPRVRVCDVDENFIRGYVEFMRKRGNGEGTVSRSLAVLRSFVNRLWKAGLMKERPFERIPIHKCRSRRTFLEVDELTALYHGFLSGRARLTPPERDALRAFLFSCFTGLRISDLRSLSPEEIEEGKMRKRTQKTGEDVYVPLPAQALALLPPLSAGRVFHVTDNSSFNKALRRGAAKLGVRKRLHCHVARHTFATSCLTLGIPLSVVSKLLGHTDLKTTQIYARYVDCVIDREMEKFRALA